MQSLKPNCNTLKIDKKLKGETWCSLIVNCKRFTLWFRYSGLASDIQNPTVISMISLTSHLLVYFNSAINPVIYNFMSGKYSDTDV